MQSHHQHGDLHHVDQQGLHPDGHAHGLSSRHYLEIGGHYGKRNADEDEPPEQIQQVEIFCLSFQDTFLFLSRLKKQRQMELRKGLPIWALEATGWGWATVLMVCPMACPMALATMAAMLVMAHMGYGRDLWMMQVGQDLRGPQNRFMDLVMDLDMAVMALATVDLEATASMAMVSMVMVCMVDTFGRDLPKTPLQNQ